jgi:hypothetical protein
MLYEHNHLLFPETMMYLVTVRNPKTHAILATSQEHETPDSKTEEVLLVGHPEGSYIDVCRFDENLVVEDTLPGVNDFL